MATKASLGWLPIAGCALSLWLLGVALATWWFEPTRDVVVFAPARQTSLKTLSSGDARIVDIPRLGVVARGLQPGFVARLYGAGAWLVLPARAGGCAGRLFERERVGRPSTDADAL